MHANVTRRAAMGWTGAAFALPVTQASNLEIERMAFTPKFVDLARNFTTVQGTGPVPLGQAVSGYTSLAAALSAGDQFYYCIQGVDKPQEREVGRGTMQADGRIGRESVLGGLTHFSSGTKTIALVTAAEWFTRVDQGGSASIEAASRSALAGAAATRGPAMLTERGREGLFAWDASDLSAMVAIDTHQGLHVAPASDPTGASGAWVRKFDGPVSPLWFGLTDGDAGGANGAANSAAVRAMMATLRARAVNRATFYQGAEGVRFPTGYFELAETIDISDATMVVEGADTGYPAGRGTVLKFPAGVTGIRVQRYNTSGGGGAAGVEHRGGDGSIIRNLALRGAYEGTEAEAHGIQLRGRATVENIHIDDFEGDGIYSNATAGGPSNEGNSNDSRVTGCRIQNCRNGIYVSGADANIWTVTAIDVTSNRQWGIWDSSFLGNSYFGCHSADNGVSENGSPSACVSHGGNRYGVIAGQEAGASTNAPSGITADNAWWYYIGPGGVHQNFPAWTSGTAYRAGGAYRTDDANARNVFVGCYAESGQGMAQLVAPSLVLGGLLATHMRNTVGALTASTGGLTLNGNVVSTGIFQSRLSGNSFGPTSGAASDNTFNLEHTNNSIILNFRKWVGGAPTVEATIQTAAGQLIVNHATTIALRTGNSERVRLTANELRPASDNVLDLGLPAQRWESIFGYTGDFTTQVKVAGVKVLGAQGAAVADAAAMTSVDAVNAAAAPSQAEFNALVAEFNKLRADLAASRTQLNMALSRLRAHGLIAA